MSILNVCHIMHALRETDRANGEHADGGYRHVFDRLLDHLLAENPSRGYTGPI